MGWNSFRKITWKNTFHKSLKERNYSNVIFVTKPMFWIHIVHQFMKIEKYSSVKFVITAVPRRLTWKKKNMASVHEGKKPFKCEVCYYMEKRTMKSHIASIHEGKKFQCKQGAWYSFMRFKNDSIKPLLHKKRFQPVVWFKLNENFPHWIVLSKYRGPSQGPLNIWTEHSNCQIHTIGDSKTLIAYWYPILSWFLKKSIFLCI